MTELQTCAEREVPELRTSAVQEGTADHEETKHGKESTGFQESEEGLASLGRQIPPVEEDTASCERTSRGKASTG